MVLKRPPLWEIVRTDAAEKSSHPVGKLERPWRLLDRVDHKNSHEWGFLRAVSPVFNQRVIDYESRRPHVIWNRGKITGTRVPATKRIPINYKHAGHLRAMRRMYGL